MKKVVRNTPSRKDIQAKVALALEKGLGKSLTGKNPSLSKESLPKEKQQFIQDRLVRNAKNRKRFNNRPSKIIVDTTMANVEIPTYSVQSQEQSTPIWFRKNKENIKVSIIVPMYKSRDVIIDLVKSWPIDDGIDSEFIFVDDNCPELSKEAVIKAWNSRKKEITQPIGKVICNKTNAGYGGACNSGAKHANGEFLIFLNADTELTKGWVQPMLDLFEDPKVGIVGNLQLKRGGGHNETIDSAGSEWRWGDNSFVHIGRHSYKRRNIQKPFTIKEAPADVLEISEREMVTGCCFAIRKSLFEYIGGFNPNYRIGYWEDSEICMNVRELGYKVMFTPKSIIYHKLGHTGSGGHKYFHHNKNYFKSKWINSGRLHELLIPPEPRPTINSILVKRSNATGDALVATGVCSALKKKYPEAKIMFSSFFPEIAANNPYIDQFIPVGQINKVTPDVFYNLDLCYEWRPNVNILDAYAEACGVKAKDCTLFLAREEFNKFDLPEDFIVIHPGKTNWAGRDWPHENFIELSTKLQRMGYKIVSVGKHTEEVIPCDVDTRGQTNIFQLAWIMSKAKLFIGIDSFPMHVAQIADIPGISFFGCIDPKLRIYNQKMMAITAKNLSCLGCHHRHPAPSTVTKACETRTLDCIKMVSVTDMLNVVKSMLKEPSKDDIVSLLG